MMIIRIIPVILMIIKTVFNMSVVIITARALTYLNSHHLYIETL